MIADPELREIIRQFFALKVIEVSAQKPFVLASGKESPVYIDHRRIFSDASLRQRLVRKWAQFLVAELGQRPASSVVMAGTATAGIVPAFALAEAFSCGFVYVRESAKEHGAGRRIEGLWSPGNEVVVVDDMVTTGGSILKAIDYLRSEGANILCATSISTHDFRNTQNAFRQANVPLRTLFRTTDVFDVAYGMSLLGTREMRALMQWMSENEVVLPI